MRVSRRVVTNLKRLGAKHLLNVLDDLPKLGDNRRASTLGASGGFNVSLQRSQERLDSLAHLL